MFRTIPPNAMLVAVVSALSVGLADSWAGSARRGTVEANRPADGHDTPLFCDNCDGADELDPNGNGDSGQVDVDNGDPTGERRKRDFFPDCPENTAAAEMIYEVEGMDLETGTIHSVNMGVQAFDPDVDFHVSFDPRSKAPLRVVAEFPAMIGIFAEPFDGVTCEDVMIISFSPDPDDTPIGPDDSVIVFTPEGNYFKLGNFVDFNDDTVEFDFVQLCVACEPEAVDSQNDSVDDHDLTSDR